MNFLLRIIIVTLVRKWETTQDKEKLFALGKNQTHHLWINLISSCSTNCVMYKVRQKHVMADLGGNYTNVNVKGTNECCATCTKDTMMDQRINSAGYVQGN